MNRGRRIAYILAGLLLALLIGYFIFTGTQVGPVDFSEIGEETAGGYG